MTRPLQDILVAVSLASAYWRPTHATGSFLSSNLVTRDPVQDVLEHLPAKTASCHDVPNGPIEATACDYETVESVNGELFNDLRVLVQTPFFRYFQVDLYRECPFWQENGFCMSRECGITTVNESQIPEKWRAATLSKIELPPLEDRIQLPGCYYHDSDFCYLDDMTEGEYFDLPTIPERYTGYSGPSAHRVWRSIYEENCFGISELTLSGGKPPVVSVPNTMSDAHPRNSIEDSHQCLEKRVYYKIISGLHASISTHICLQYLNQTTGEWAPNLQCFITRVASHPERLQHIYFNTVLLLRAVARIGPYLSSYDYCSSGTKQDDAATREKLTNVIELAHTVGKFDETTLFRGDNAIILKEEFKSHFRNVSQIMDCIGCDKCRLWGKVQVTGVATALKILFEMDEKVLDPSINANLLRRSEVVALLNTLHRFSESLEAVNQFRRMWAEIGPSESTQLIRDAEETISSSSSAGSTKSNGRGDSISLLSGLRRCQDGAEVCIDTVTKIWHRGSKALSSIFKPSRKRLGPSAFEDL